MDDVEEIIYSLVKYQIHARLLVSFQSTFLHIQETKPMGVVYAWPAFLKR